MDLLCHTPSASASHPPPQSRAGQVQQSNPSTGVAAPGGRGRRGGGRTWLSRFLGDLLTGLLTCIFAIIGSIVGAITGALIGLATESGLLRGAGIGSISGAVFCIEAVEASVAMWHSNGSGLWSLLFVLDIILSLVSGRIVYEKVDPAVQNAVQSQMSAVDAPFREIEDIFETGSISGMPTDSVEKLPKMIVTEEKTVDAAGEQICCSVCLQDFEVGEVARCLPQCQHMFHIPCIDGWLVRHGSCPLCRRDL